jgi:hypothetical protein
MLYEATMESLEDASLAIQKTLTIIKELRYNRDCCYRAFKRSIEGERSEAREHLEKMCQIEKQIERELKSLINILDSGKEGIAADIRGFKEMVFRAGLKTKVANIGALINKEINALEGSAPWESNEPIFRKRK